MKVLFIVPSLNITVLDNHCWLTGNVLIKNMTADHLHNAILWSWRRHKAEEETGIGNMKMQGLTYYEWYMVLKGEKERREKEDKESLIQLLKAERDQLQPELTRKRRLREIEEELKNLQA